jgi:hypothetical protein
VSKGVIFQELRVAGGDIIQFILFVHAFNAFKSPLFYNHHNRENDVTITPFTMGTYQGDLGGGCWGGWGTLFALAHFRVLCSTVSHFPFCLFPSIVDDTYIIGPPSIVSSIYEHFQIELRATGFSIQPQKCIAWSPSMPLDFNTPS